MHIGSHEYANEADNDVPKPAQHSSAETKTLLCPDIDGCLLIAFEKERCLFL